MENQNLNQVPKISSFYQKLSIILGAIILIIGGVFAWQHFRVPAEEDKINNLEKEIKSEETETINKIELTRENALYLLKKGLFIKTCSSEKVWGYYSSCTIDISRENNQWIVIVTHNGLFDDSVNAERRRAIITYKDGQWVVEEVFLTWKCQLGRGHQYFSTKPCI